jgi:two-component system, cell cycle response regulator
MEQSNLQPVSTDSHAPSPLSVAILGFEEIDQQSFRRFFQVSRPYQRRYLAATRAADMVSSDILMVNYDNPSALAERDAIVSKCPRIQVVAVSRVLLDEPPVHHIRGMLFAARVLNALDKVNVEPPPKTVSEKPQEMVVDAPQPATEIPALTPQVIGLQASPIQAAPTATNTTVQAITVLPTPKTPIVELPEPHIQAKPVAEKPVPVVQATTVEADKSAAIPDPAPALTAPVSLNTDGYRALVVDDSPAIQKSLELNLVTLPQIGMIHFADTGESALEKAEATQYDLIFLDVMMPGIDGYETCTRLRKKPEYKKTPIIMVSGKTSPLDEVKGVMAGCTTYLTKPVQQEAFQKLSIRVLAWLEKQIKP